MSSIRHQGNDATTNNPARIWLVDMYGQLSQHQRSLQERGYPLRISNHLESLRIKEDCELSDILVCCGVDSHLVRSWVVNKWQQGNKRKPIVFVGCRSVPSEIPMLASHNCRVLVDVDDFDTLARMIEELQFALFNPETNKPEHEEQPHPQLPMAALDCLTAGVFHDIKNYLVLVTANLETLKSRSVSSNVSQNEDFDSLVDEAIVGAYQIADLARGSLHLSGRGRHRTGKLNMTDTLVSSAKIARGYARQHNTTIIVDLKEDLWVDANASVLFRLCANLITNAIDALSGSHNIAGEPTVLIGGKADDRFVYVQIKDNSSKEIPESISQIVGTSEDGDDEHFGIGLEFCRSAIASLGGEFGLKKEAGWSVASIILPLAEPSDPN